MQNSNRPNPLKSLNKVSIALSKIGQTITNMIADISEKDKWFWYKLWTVIMILALGFGARGLFEMIGLFYVMYHVTKLS
jgi:hypothetical protein